jgi:hypothetical protein
MLCLSYYCLCLLFNKIGEESRTGSAWNQAGCGGQGGIRRQRGEMAQTMYVHINKWVNKKNIKILKNKGEWWREWIQIWYISCFIRTFIMPQCTPMQPNNKKNNFRGWDVARWYSASLACVRPWVQSQHQKRKDKKKK